MWKKTTDDQLLFDGSPYMKLIQRGYQTAAGLNIPNYYLFEVKNWVNVVALTPDFKIVLVNQFRPGADKMLRGLPAGTLDSDDELPELTAQRELLEETGYTADTWIPLSSQYANPATQMNRVYSYLALNAQPGKFTVDPSEETEPFTMPFLEYLEDTFEKALHSDEQALFTSALLFAVRRLLKMDFPQHAEFREQLKKILMR